MTVGVQTGSPGGHIYFVRDNGVGFDMAYANKLFVPFKRLHPDAEFLGSGIGLVTAQRKSSRVMAAASGPKPTSTEGATFYFTINAPLARACSALKIW